jgi:hypothetical protein
MVITNTSASAPTSTAVTRTWNTHSPSETPTIERSVVVSTPPSAMPVRIAIREHGAAKYSWSWPCCFSQ